MRVKWLLVVDGDTPFVTFVKRGFLLTLSGLFTQDRHQNIFFSLLRKRLAKSETNYPKKTKILLRADFAVSVKEQELALLTGLKRAAFIIRSRQSLGKSSRIRMNESRRLEERGRIAVDEHKRGLMAVRGSPYRRCDGLCVCISVRCIARQDSAIRRCALSANQWV